MQSYSHPVIPQTCLIMCCCLLLQVLAAQGYKPRPGLLSALLDITFDAMSSYSPGQLASMVHSLGTCGCKASVQWMSHLMGRIRMAGLEVGGCLPVCHGTAACSSHAFSAMTEMLPASLPSQRRWFAMPCA
jgi:hypothetical protein